VEEQRAEKNYEKHKYTLFKNLEFSTLKEVLCREGNLF
jgi:hypothetical protein